MTPPEPTDPESPPPEQLVNERAGLAYWQSIPPDINGMLGGYPQISDIDLIGSRIFLAKMGIGTRGNLTLSDRTLEAGAGIGRITKGLLVDVSDEVDVVEPIEKFCREIEDYPGVGTVFPMTLEEWTPIDNLRYNVVWIQWCVGHLRDWQLVEFLKRCVEALTPGGFIALKENIAMSGTDEYDDKDSSVTRCVSLSLSLSLSL